MTDGLTGESVQLQFDQVARARGAVTAARPRRGAIIVVGNEKGGTGKSTTAMHLAIGLMQTGRTVASVDLDSHQASLTRYIEHRRKLIESTRIKLRVPDHQVFAAAALNGLESPGDQERRLGAVLRDAARGHDFVVVDCPGSDLPVSRFAVARADVLVTPLNDSFIDLDLLAHMVGVPPRIIRVGRYGEMVCEQQRLRARRAEARIEWLVLRNRFTAATTRNSHTVGAALTKLSQQLGFRVADGFGERVIFRELFLMGLTILDLRRDEPLVAGSRSHLAAHSEASNLIKTVSAVARRRAENGSMPPAGPAAKSPVAAQPPATPPRQAATKGSDKAPATRSELPRPAPATPPSPQAAKAPARAPDAKSPAPAAAAARVNPAGNGDGRRRNLLVIYNPAAGWRGQRRFRATLRYLARLGCVVTVRETAGPGEAQALAKKAIDESYDAVVAAGGDGTLNETVNALAGSSMALGILPLGTLDALATEVGLPTDPKSLARVIAEGKARPIYLGFANGRRFSVAAGVGFDAHVAGATRHGLKQGLGRLAYMLRGMVQLVHYRPAAYSVTVDGRTFIAAAVVLANARSYFGRLAYAPDARLDDPRLQVCLMSKPGRWNVVRYGLAVMLRRLHRLPDVAIMPATSVTITDPAGEPVHVDGDVVVRLPAKFGVAPHRVNILTPS